MCTILGGVKCDKLMLYKPEKKLKNTGSNLKNAKRERVLEYYSICATL